MGKKSIFTQEELLLILGCVADEAMREREHLDPEDPRLLELEKLERKIEMEIA